MQNKYQQRHSQSQYLHHHRIKTHSTNSQKQIHHKDIETQTFPSAAIIKCALQFTTRLNTLENRMDALETLLLYGRPETRTIDTLTARRISGLKKRRRSRRIVSASMLEDIHDERLAQHGITPRYENQPLRSTHGPGKNMSDCVAYGKFRAGLLGEDQSGGMGLDVESTTVDYDEEMRNTSPEQLRTPGSSTSLRSRRLRPRSGTAVSKGQDQNLPRHSAKPTRNVSSSSLASLGTETLQQHTCISNKTNNSSVIESFLTEVSWKSSQSSDRPSLITDDAIRELVLLPLDLQISILKEERHPTSSQIQTTTQQIQTPIQAYPHYPPKSINFSKPLPPKQPLAQIQHPIPKPLQTRKPTPHHNPLSQLQSPSKTHIRTISSTTTISTSTVTTASTAITSYSSPSSSVSVRFRTSSSISSVSYPASEEEEEDQLEDPEHSPTKMGFVVEDSQSNLLAVQERKQQKVLSESGLKAAIELWIFDVGERCRV